MSIAIRTGTGRFLGIFQPCHRFSGSPSSVQPSSFSCWGSPWDWAWSRPRHLRGSTADHDQESSGLGRRERSLRLVDGRQRRTLPERILPVRSSRVHGRYDRSGLRHRDDASIDGRAASLNSCSHEGRTSFRCCTGRFERRSFELTHGDPSAGSSPRAGGPSTASSRNVPLE